MKRNADNVHYSLQSSYSCSPFSSHSRNATTRNRVADARCCHDRFVDFHTSSATVSFCVRLCDQSQPALELKRELELELPLFDATAAVEPVSVTTAGLMSRGYSGGVVLTIIIIIVDVVADAVVTRRRLHAPSNSRIASNGTKKVERRKFEETKK